MTAHRVPLLGERWRRSDDPERSRDPHVRALVGQLGTVALAPAPDPAFRAELRAQLVAIAPRIVAEGIADETALVDILPAKSATRKASAPEHAPARPRFRMGRVFSVAGALIVAFTLILGGAVVMSKKALPGDTLYGLKRASERIQLATDGSDAERATDLLGFASTRTDEVQQLIGRSTATASGQGLHAGVVNSATGALIRSTLADANSDTTDASRLLSTQAVQDRSASPLTDMTNWAPGQLARLRAIWSSLPPGSLRSTTRKSLHLVSQAQVRARELITSVHCTCAASAPSDKLGPKPCTTCPAPTTKAPVTPATGTGNPNKHATTRPISPKKQAPVGQPSRRTPVTGNPLTSPARAPRSPAPTPTRSGGLLPKLPILPTLPSLPPVLPTAPVSASSCGVTVNVLGVSVNLGKCSGQPTP